MSVPSRIPHIPQDLVECTLRYLTDDPEALHQCALVGHLWQQPAQAQIFHTISLGVGLQDGFASGLLELPPLGPVQDLYHSFHDLLAESPHLAPHIRVLNLGLRPLQSEIPLNTVSYGSWNLIEDSIVKFLPLLQGLKSLGLFPCGPSTHTYHLQSCIIDAFRTISPHELRFFGWSFLDCSALNAFRVNTRTSLEFIECEFQAASSHSNSVPVDHDLASVIFDHCTGLVSFSRFWIPKQHTYTKDMTVEIVYLPETALAASQEMFNISLSVGRGLTIRIATVREDSPPIFSLASFSHLQSLHLSFADNYDKYSGTWFPIPMTWLETAFEAFILLNGLTLCLTIITDASVPCSRHPDWEGRLHSRLEQNPTLNMESHTSRSNQDSVGCTVEYTFRSNA
ncbi:hypothetical protein FB451DRAFT_1167976 [Mycena latifolia]|nr:hypothetical protein FB451DRAFT_1167976 [Mycena latifolia]